MSIIDIDTDDFYKPSENMFLNIDRDVVYRPIEPVNPLLWFGFYGNASSQRKPNENEKLMCMYVLLAVINDGNLKYRETPTDTLFFSADYESKWFQRNKFRIETWVHYSTLQNPQGQGSCIFPNYFAEEDKLRQLTLAFEKVKEDLAGTIKTKVKLIYEKGVSAINTLSSEENWEAIKKEYDINKKDFGKKINFVKDSFKRKVIFRDVEHAYVLASQGFGKPAIILAGSVIEELLRLYLDYKNIKMKSDDGFFEYIKACEDNRFLKRGVLRLTDSVRDFRNLVHLAKETEKKHTLSKATAKGAVSSIFTIANDFQ
jgi:hypothetical protein